MGSLQGTLQGIGTVLVMLAFLGICWWAYSKSRKKDFEEASLLPFEADEENGTENKEQDRL